MWYGCRHQSWCKLYEHNTNWNVSLQLLNTDMFHIQVYEWWPMHGHQELSYIILSWVDPYLRKLYNCNLNYHTLGLFHHVTFCHSIWQPPTHRCIWHLKVDYWVNVTGRRKLHAVLRLVSSSYLWLKINTGNSWPLCLKGNRCIKCHWFTYLSFEMTVKNFS